MKPDDKFLWTQELQGSRPIKFVDLPRLIASAIHSDEDACALAEIDIRRDLDRMIDSGTLVVRSPATMGPHTFPLGAQLKSAVLHPWEVRPLFEAHGIALHIVNKERGPDFWTIDEAAKAIGVQERWERHAVNVLRDQMMEAALHWSLPIYEPQTGIVIEKPGSVLDVRELVRPSDVNAWLETSRADFHWVRPPDVSTDAPTLRPVEPINRANKQRSNDLDGLINEVRSASRDPANYHDVYNTLTKMALLKDRPIPLLGYEDDEGIKYLAASRKDGVKYLTKAALKGRFYRDQKRQKK